MERTGDERKKTSLSCKGQRISLGLIRKLWQTSGDGDNSNSLRIYKFTRDHFFKNAFNRMRVHLATQITSLSTIRLIDESLATGTCEYTEEELAPMKEILFTLDQTIDIMNAKSNHNGVKKLGEKINNPKHRHLAELLSTLAIFTDWKKEAGKFDERFIPIQSYEDMTWMIFSVVGISILYLNEDGSLVFDQGRSGSDCCEHHFGNIRMRYGSANILNCELATGKATSSRSCTFVAVSRTNTAGARKETTSELFDPLIKKGKGIV